MSVENKITVLGTGGSIFEFISSDNNEEHVKNYIDSIRNNIDEFHNSYNVIDEVIDFNYTPIKEVLENLTSRHINLIVLTLDLYRDTLDFPKEYDVALKLFENGEYIKEVSIILED